MSLERELRELGPAWPPTPDVAATVAGRIVPRSPRQPRLLGQPWLRPALVAVLVLLLAAAAAVPPVRAGIERLLGVAGGERIERVDRVPRAARRLDLGSPATLAEASRRTDAEIALPGRLGAPDGVRVGGDLGSRAVSLLFGGDTVLSQIPAASTIGAVKQIGSQGRLRVVTIRGRTGFWIAPGERALVLPGAIGGATATTRRTALPGASVLLWDRGGAAYRLETRRPFAEAVAIARSVPAR